MERTEPVASSSLPLQWMVILVVLLILIGWLLNTPEGLLGKGDAVGYAVCHRIDLRSFHLGDRPLPLCARCTGMYLGALVGLGYQRLLGSRRTGVPPRSVIIVLVFLGGSFALDGLNSLFSLILNRGLLYEPNNTLRLFTGTGMGLLIAAALFPAFNQTVWREYRPEPSLSGIPSFLGLIGIAGIIDLLVLTENPVILFPLALASASGVVIVLTILYTMVSTIILRKENKFDRWSQLGFVGFLGFGVGLLQIAFLDVIRFWLTGTWDGFHFG
jgi:uncharacterized membrane protein